MDNPLTPAELEALTAGEREIWRRYIAAWGYQIPSFQSLSDIPALLRTVAGLRLRLLSAAGDDLCRLTQDEIKQYTSGTVQIPPKEEFIASCERFHAQIANEAGVLSGCLTLAQLIAENEQLRQRLDAALAAPSPATVEWEWRADNAPVPCPAHLAPKPATEPRPSMDDPYSVGTQASPGPYHPYTHIPVPDTQPRSATRDGKDGNK